MLSYGYSYKKYLNIGRIEHELIKSNNAASRRVPVVVNNIKNIHNKDY